MLRINGRKKTVAIAAACALIAAAGAYAFWTSTGAGTGTATSDTYDPVTISQTTVIDGLYPGGPAVPIGGNVVNPNPGVVTVGTVTVAFANTPITNGDGPPPCTTADYVLANPTVTINAPLAGLATRTWTGPTIQMVNDLTANQDACKNAVVHLKFSSN